MSDQVVTRFKEPKKPTPAKKKQSLVKQLDALCGSIVRARGRCENCGKTSDLQWAHGFSRRYRNIRWRLDATFCLCRGCHLKFTMRPLEWDEWLRARWGEELYAELRTRALAGGKVDHKAVLAELRGEVAA